MTNGTTPENDRKLLRTYTFDDLHSDMMYAAGDDNLEINIPDDVLEQLKNDLADAVAQVIGEFIDNNDFSV
jgi:hypothetical protein